MIEMSNEDDIKYTRIILVEAERRALEEAALYRGRLDKLYRSEKRAQTSPNHIVNPEVLAKWRNEAMQNPPRGVFKPR